MSAYREVDLAHRRRAVITEARRIRDALDGHETFHHIAGGKISSSQEIIDVITACIQELS